MNKRWIDRLLFSLVFMAFSGCASNRAYHLDETPVVVPLGKQDFRMAFIEFDEQGDFWDRAQMATVVGEIEEIGKRGVLLITYVHGWQNNAFNSYDVRQFHELLRDLALSKAVQEKKLQVYGVYLGWRGSVYRRFEGPIDHVTDLPRVMSFYNRKAAATRIASSPVTEAVFTLIKSAREQSRASKCILVGHSFGALVLEKAISEAMVGTLLYAPPERRGKGRMENAPIYTPADLVLLINSAAESIYAKKMIDMLSDAAPGRQKPLVISITSRADSATRLLFPAGTRLSNIPKLIAGNFRSYGNGKPHQYFYFTRTQGHNDSLQSHEIVKIEGKHDPVELDCFDENITHPKGKPRGTVFVTGRDRSKPDWWRIEPRGPNHTPYWVVRVPRALIQGHGGIFEDAPRQMLASMFVVGGNATSSQPATINISIRSAR
jgi:hypothetical protein